MHSRSLILGLLAMLAVAFTPAAAQNTTTAKVGKRDFSQTEKSDGILAPRAWTEIRLDLKAFEGQLRVTSLFEPGAPVKAGDAIVTFDTADLERVIAEAAMAQKETTNALAQARAELEMFDEQQRQTLQLKEQALRDRQTDLDEYRNLTGPDQLAAYQLAVERTKANLENAREELAQLEKMYGESDLAVDTQEIVLNRAKRQIQFVEQDLKSVTLRQQIFTSRQHPDRLRDLQQTVEQTTMDLAHARRRAELTRTDKLNAVARAEFNLARADKRLADLHADMQTASVRAPSAGVMAHGAILDAVTQGRSQGRVWGDYAIRPGDRFGNGAVVASIFDPAAYDVIFDIPQARMSQLQQSVNFEITVPGVSGNLALVNQLQLSYLPGKSNDGRVFRAAINLNADSGWIRPGLTVNVQYPAVSKDQLALPEHAVYERDGKSWCAVHTGNAGEAPREQRVTVGARDGGFVQILDGLKEGDTVSYPVEGK